VFSSFVSHRSSAFFRIMRLIAFETRLTAALHPGSLVSCHNFLILFLCFISPSSPGRSLFNSDTVILLVDNLHAEATEAVKARRFIGFYPELISILGDIKFEARL
jgi:hypothetical protein